MTCLRLNAHIQHIVFVFCLFCTSHVMLYSAPAEHLRMYVTLTDGSRLEVTKMGDEYYSYFLSDEGDVVVRDSLGFRFAADGELEALIARSDELKRMAHRRVGSAETAPLAQHGVQRIPVVLVSFADKDFTVGVDGETVNQYYHLYCNGNADGEPYTGHGSHGSLREYFYEQSGGNFQPVFTTIGPVKLDKGYAYYGQNSADDVKKDLNYAEFCSEAIAKATAKGVDWSTFDNDGDGNVDFVMFVFAGLGENNSFDTDAIWPKEVSGYSTLSGVRFAANSSVSEQRLRKDSQGAYSPIPDGVGVFVHEMSHALGLPDFYDTRGKNFGMDYWSVMDYGEYADNGYTPVGYTAYERDFMGWQSLQTIDKPSTIRLSDFASGGCGWKIVSDFNSNEYYVLENRQATGWDVKLCSSRGHGLMITHVDYSQRVWTSNAVNVDADHQRMTIIPANNSFVGSNNATSLSQWTESLRGNLWPSAMENHELTDNTTPASILYTGKYMSKPIVDILEDEDGVVTLKFMPRGTLGVVTGVHATDSDVAQVTLYWDEVAEAQCYNVRVFDGDDEVYSADSIQGTHCHVEGLQDDHTYTYSVQALSDEYLNGDWSVPAAFSTQATVISDMLESEMLVRVYAVNGLFVTECRADEIGRLSLRAGVYLLRYPNLSVKKVYIR